MQLGRSKRRCRKNSFIRGNWGGAREGAGRTPLSEYEKKKGCKIYITKNVKEDIIKYGIGNNFSDKSVDLILEGINSRKKNN